MRFCSFKLMVAHELAPTPVTGFRRFLVEAMKPLAEAQLFLEGVKREIPEEEMAAAKNHIVGDGVLSMIGARFPLIGSVVKLAGIVELVRSKKILDKR